MTTAETVTLSWSPDSKAAQAAATGDGTRPGGSAQPALVIPSRLGSVRLIRELGHGGMGVVWLGHHEFLDRQVAVKFLLATVTDRDDPRFQVFLDGARAAAQVRHLGLTAVLHADMVENVPYLVMEYVSGPTLAELVERTGPLRLPAALAVLERIADALDKLHEAGVIHRDIKPSNILVDVQGQAYLTDFGLACRVENRERIMTSGTPAYMAPECFDGEASARTDIYALAATTYHLLAGRAPYEGSVAALRELHKAGVFPPEPLQAVAIPKPVIELLQRAANNDPRFRTKSCHKLLDGFREASGKTVTAAAGIDQLARLVGAVKSRATVGPATLVSAIEGVPASATPEIVGAPHDLRVLASEGAVLSEPVPCVQCGYELRGLPTAARCPECQRPIEHSLRKDRLIFADPAWLRRIHLGLLIMASAPLVLIITLAGLSITRLAIHTLPTHYGVWAVSSTMVALVLGAIGAYFASTRESMEGVREPYRPARWGLAAAAAFVGVVLGAFYLRHAWDAQSVAWETRLGMIFWLVAGLAMCAIPAHIIACLHRLLGRGHGGRVRSGDSLARLCAVVATLGIVGLAATSLSVAVFSDRSPSQRLALGFFWLASLGALVFLAVLTYLAWRLGLIRRTLLSPAVARVEGAPESPGKSSTYYQSLSSLAGKRRVNAPTPEPQPAATVPEAPGGVLVCLVKCVSCGRDLVGSSVQAGCPGCAAPVLNSLDPARLSFVPSTSLRRASQGLDRAALTLMVGLLLLGVTVPFQLIVVEAAGVLSMVYAPFWFAVTVIALDGCRAALGRLSPSPLESLLAPWRVAFWAVGIGALASQLIFAVWLVSSGSIRFTAEGSGLVTWPALVLLVPSAAVPVALAGLGRVIARGHDPGSARTLLRVASLLPLTLAGIGWLILASSSALSTGMAMVVFLTLLLALMPTAFFGLRLASRRLRAAADSAADYGLVRRAIDSAPDAHATATGGGSAQAS
ncbi:MAG: serine/threonine protein kinase [Phycisphaerales bacterium]|nr:serine/threonine protein kinase [Phycisphaerales bacterium]